MSEDLEITGETSSSPRHITVYLDINTNILYNEAGKPYNSNTLTAILGDNFILELHYVKDASNSTNPEEWSIWDSLEGRRIQSTVSFDDNYIHAVEGTVVENTNTGSSSVKINVPVINKDILGFSGNLVFNPFSPEPKIVSYSAFNHISDTVFEFIIDDIQGLPIDVYGGGSNATPVRISEPLCLYVSSNDIYESNIPARYDAGIFNIPMKVISRKLLKALDYSDVSGVSGKLEHKIYTEANVVKGIDVSGTTFLRNSEGDLVAKDATDDKNYLFCNWVSDSISYWTRGKDFTDSISLYTVSNGSASLSGISASPVYDTSFILFRTFTFPFIVKNFIGFRGADYSFTDFAFNTPSNSYGEFTQNLFVSVDNNGTASIGLSGSTSFINLIQGNNISITAGQSGEIVINSTVTGGTGEVIVTGNTGTVTGITSSVSNNSVNISTIGGVGNVKFVGAGDLTISSGDNGEIVLGSTFSEIPQDLSVSIDTGSASITLSGSTNTIKLIEGDNITITAGQNNEIRISSTVTGNTGTVTGITHSVTVGSATVSTLGGSNSIVFTCSGIVEIKEGDNHSIDIYVPSGATGSVTGITSSVNNSTATISSIGGSGSVKFNGGTDITLEEGQNGEIVINSTVTGNTGTVTGLTHSVSTNSATVSTVGGSGSVVFIGDGNTTISTNSNNAVVIGSTFSETPQDLSVSVDDGTASISISESTSNAKFVGDGVDISETTNGEIKLTVTETPAQDIQASVDNGTAFVLLSGSTSVVSFVGTGSVTLSENTNGEIEINATGGGGGGSGGAPCFPDYLNPLATSVSLSASYFYSESVWLIGNVKNGDLFIDISYGGNSNRVYLINSSGDSYYPISLLIPANASFELSYANTEPVVDIKIYPCISSYNPPANYTVNRSSGTDGGSIFRGLSERGDTAIIIDSSLDGEPIDFEGASVL